MVMTTPYKMGFTMISKLKKFAKFGPLFEEKINQITSKYLEYYAAVMWP